MGYTMNDFKDFDNIRFVFGKYVSAKQAEIQNTSLRKSGLNNGMFPTNNTDGNIGAT
jgi:hypothetical protein